MKMLVVQNVARPGGRTSQVKKTVSAEWIRIGRNASCEIHLPDPRIALEQGMIVNRQGPVYIEGEAGSQDITRKSVRSVRMKPGEPLDIGPYRLEALETPPGYDAAVSVQLVRPLEAVADLGSRSARKTLASIGFSKRSASWTGLIAILVACLLIPAARVLHLPWGGGDTDRMWNPGPVMLAHQPIGDKCSACHEVAFEHVNDRACLECHGRIGHHVAAPLRNAALFEGVRCASCHREHKGAKPLHRDDDGFCVDCHRDIHARSPRTQIKDVSDFASNHPAFLLAVRDGESVRRVRQQAGQPIHDDPGLAFPHAKHLDPAGVRSPDKGRIRLECANCHHPDASGKLFEPITMGRDCQGCHRLDIEPAVTKREVPHGDPKAAVAMIDEFYASLALNGVADSFTKAFGTPGEGLLRRTGDPTPEQRQDALRLATRKARSVAIDLFEVRVCKTCHEVHRDAGARSDAALAWTVRPVHEANRWMPQARFDHHLHERTRCIECHDVSRSKSSGDVAMPTIEKCRECHGGSQPQEKRVTSGCLLCHGFHDPRHPWDARLGGA
jgi:predicted CXXCH cytochrome family protein